MTVRKSAQEVVDKPGGMYRVTLLIHWLGANTLYIRSAKREQRGGEHAAAWLVQHKRGLLTKLAGYSNVEIVSLKASPMAMVTAKRRTWQRILRDMPELESREVRVHLQWDEEAEPDGPGW